jgi:7-carboxy-7-deazaguanine synthase
MRCVWCDSEYTFAGGDHVSIEDVMNKVRDFGCSLVEVTGGEPLAQPEALALITKLCDEAYEVLIETGGYVSTREVDQRAKIILDIKCPGSGEAERNHWPNLELLRADHDLERRARAILISPAWGQIDLVELANWIAESGMELRMQLQLHKYIWGADARGV